MPKASARQQTAVEESLPEARMIAGAARAWPRSATITACMSRHGLMPRSRHLAAIKPGCSSLDLRQD